MGEYIRKKHKFCRKCGTAMIEHKVIRGYSPETGEKIYDYFWTCKRATYGDFKEEKYNHDTFEEFDV